MIEFWPPKLLVSDASSVRMIKIERVKFILRNRVLLNVSESEFDHANKTPCLKSGGASS